MDRAEIKVAAGRGGDGCVAYRREKYVPRGGPSGGNGGEGGSVWVVGDTGSTTLLDFRYRRSYKAQNGKQGEGSNRTGESGSDLEIVVPCGTAIHDADTGELIGDLVDPGQRILVAKGGRGGKGNREFRNARRQTPDFAQPGRPGQQRNVRLELKLLADIGLVGLPNAGKSTLLSRVTAARPKVADYPFTTLIPNLGIVDLGDFQSCTIADIPGLIEGASEGKGLGLDFLRHIERTRALLYLVDVTESDPGAVLEVLHGELSAYGRRLTDLPCAVVLSKTDLLPADRISEPLAAVSEWAESHSARRVIAISAVSGDGLDDLRRLLRDLFTASTAIED